MESPHIIPQSSLFKEDDFTISAILLTELINTITLLNVFPATVIEPFLRGVNISSFKDLNG